MSNTYSVAKATQFTRVKGAPSIAEGGYLGALKADREGYVFKASPDLSHLLGTQIKPASRDLRAAGYTVNQLRGRR